jgi:exosortase
VWSVTPVEAGLRGRTATPPIGAGVRRHWPLAIGFATVAVPAVADLARVPWAQEFGAYGPIVLVTGLWLLWRNQSAIRAGAEPGATWLTLCLLAPSLAGFAVGKALDFVSLEAAGVFGAGLAIFYAKFGAKMVIRQWFPLLYLAFVVPPPPSLLADVTAPLKDFVSMVSTGILGAVGLPVARQGVTIFVAQYQLLVEDACSGMNSIVGLLAVGLLYVYLVRGANWVYMLLISALTLPIAIFANIVRIMVLILLTYYAGNDVAQGYLHFTAGIMLFAIAIVCVFSIDRVLAHWRPKWVVGRT